ncbi:MAG: molybdopterin synthase sulfur carrier subunit [Geobacteraceae bacterium GWC2_53_11]|nr:MAG: molybdopterin synthase sulfur carrier subunit [Geobacteraceae bacterium GWC2_53_11]
MRITVKLFASFRLGRFKFAEQEYQVGTDCRTIVLALGLTEAEIGVIMVNGRHAALDYVLQEGDTLSLFPLVGGG